MDHLDNKERLVDLVKEDHLDLQDFQENQVPEGLLAQKEVLVSLDSRDQMANLDQEVKWENQDHQVNKDLQVHLESEE